MCSVQLNLYCSIPVKDKYATKSIKSAFTLARPKYGHNGDANPYQKFPNNPSSSHSSRRRVYSRSVAIAN